MSDMRFNANANCTATPKDAKKLAAELHAGQTDHSGQDYILHPERVVNNLLRIYPHAPIADNMDNLHPVRTAELINSQMEKENPGKAKRLKERYTLSVQKLSQAVGIDPNLVFREIANSPALKTEFKLG